MVKDVETHIVQSQAIAQSGILQAIRSQEKAVLDQLVALYRARKLDDRSAIIGVATIAELRNLLGKLERSLLQSMNVTESLTGGDSNA
jgi:hypothetical protein